MKRELAPDTVSQVIPFTAATCERLESNVPVGKVSHCFNGGISADGKWGWMIGGASIEVVSTDSGERLGAWSFGVVAKKPRCVVTCCRELKDGKSPKLIVGLDCGTHDSMLCVFDIRRSKIVRAIEVPDKIMAVEMVSAEGGANPANHTLLNDLRYMYGIVAVGMDNGSLLLIDLFLDEPWCSDETTVRNLLFLKKPLARPDVERRDAMHTKKHFCLTLPDPYSGERALRDHDGSCVTSLKYLSQLTSIAIGYENGSVDFWNLSKLMLETAVYRATNCPSDLPVVEMAFQEPENDPSQFCYLWVARGNQCASGYEDTLACLTLYALKFSQRCWMQGIGNHYENLNDCDVRFEYYFSCNPHQAPNFDTQGSRLLRCFALRDSATPNGIETSRDDGLDASDDSLLVVVWEAWFKDCPTKLHAFIGIFDLNQWYQAQMPLELNVLSNTLSPYFGFFALEEILERAAPDFILDVQMIPGSVAHLQLAVPVEHNFYPSALAFRICCLADSGVIHASYLGLQRQILAKFKKLGVLVLMEPNEMYNMCVYSGLIRAADDNLVNMSLTKQREALLNVALENGLLEFVNSCITQAGVRDMFISSYTPKSIMEWAWKKTAQIKSSLDRICPPLFNCTGDELDSSQVRLLHMYGIQLEILASTFQLLINHSVVNTEQGLRELEMKTNVINLIILHHRVVLWFFEAGLLPEHEENQDYGPEEFSYPISLLQQAYLHRRRELQSLNQMIRDTNLLLIDNIVSLNGKSLPALWEKDGGNELYPPPNLYSLLNMYLLEDVSVNVKHCIVQYLLLDLTVCIADDKYDHLLSQLMNFPIAFNISPSLRTLTRAFWLLDHKDFEGALEHFLDPVINAADMDPWQNTVIIKSFLYQGHCKKALKYCSVRRPAVRTPEDMKLHLTVLLANELISDAFQFQRDCRDHETAADVLQHFFLGCQQTKSLGKLLQLPLNAVEEEAFIQFLQNSHDVYAQEILLMYFIQRSRFVQARMLNSSLATKLMNDQDPKEREKLSIRNMIVNGYTSVLPRVQLKLASLTESQVRLQSTTYSEAKPHPLSSSIKPGASNVTSQAVLIKTIMDSVGETWCNASAAMAATPFRSSIHQKSSNTGALNFADNVPFICTPAASRSRTELGDVASLVFPTSASKEGACNTDLDYVISPIKRSRGMEISSAKRLPSKFANLEVMSLLQMPPIHRKTPSLRSAAKTLVREQLPCSSPHSILKSQTARVAHDDSLDLSLLVKDEEMKDVDQSGLAKQLRFNVSDSASSDNSAVLGQQDSSFLNTRTRSLLPDFTNGVKTVRSQFKTKGVEEHFNVKQHLARKSLSDANDSLLLGSSFSAAGTSSTPRAERAFRFREPIGNQNVVSSSRQTRSVTQKASESRLERPHLGASAKINEEPLPGTTPEFVFQQPLEIDDDVREADEESASSNRLSAGGLGGRAPSGAERMAVDEPRPDIGPEADVAPKRNLYLFASSGFETHGGNNNMAEIAHESSSAVETDRSDIESVHSSRSGMESSRDQEPLHASPSTVTASTPSSSSPASKASSAKTSPSITSSPITRSQTKSQPSRRVNAEDRASKHPAQPSASLQSTTVPSKDDEGKVQTAVSSNVPSGDSEVATERSPPRQPERKASDGSKVAKPRKEAQQRGTRRLVYEEVTMADTFSDMKPSKPDLPDESSAAPASLEVKTSGGAVPKEKKDIQRIKSAIKRTPRTPKPPSAMSIAATPELTLTVPSTHGYNTRASVSGDSISSVSPTSSICSTASIQKKAGKRGKVSGHAARSTKSSSDEGPSLSPAKVKHKFFFSPPEVPIEQSPDVTEALVEVKPFIFSPPLTRSRSKKVVRKSSETMETESAQDAAKHSKSITVKKSKRNRNLPTSPKSIHSNSPINFISPAVLAKGSETGTHKKKTASSKAVRLLRSRTQAPLRLSKLS